MPKCISHIENWNSKVLYNNSLLELNYFLNNAMDKIDKQLVVYRFLGNVIKDVHP